jgi:hypothetical protein
LKKRTHNRLYRYQRFSEAHDIDKERLEDLLVGNRIHFYSPICLNDPYDCKIQFSIKDVTKEMLLEASKLACKRKSPEMSDEELERQAKIYYQYTTYKTPQGQAKFREFTKDLLQPELNLMGLLCLTKKEDSILMWTYYADGHKGICLIFDEGVVSNNFYLAGIDYNDDFLSFQEFMKAMFMHDIDRSFTLQRLLLRKGDSLWKHEDERRIVIPAESIEKKGRNFNCPSGLLTGIIFGCLMPEESKLEIVDILKRRPKRLSKIKLYEAKRNDNYFKLDISPVKDYL